MMLKYYFFLLFVLLAHLVSSSPISLPRPVRGKFSGMDRLDEPRLKVCLGKCPVNLDLSPQCASDGKSYPNTGTVYCLEKCLKPFGEDLKIAHGGYCENDILPNES